MKTRTLWRIKIRFMRWTQIYFMLIVFGGVLGFARVPVVHANLVCSLALFELSPLHGMGYYTQSGQTVDPDYGRANYSRFSLMLGLKNFAELEWAFDQVPFGAPRIGVGDMSLKSCRQFEPHKSRAHQFGRAVDLRLMSTLGERSTTTNRNDYDRGRTISMIHGLIVSIGNYNVAFVCLKDHGFTFKLLKDSGEEVPLPVVIAGVPVKPCAGDSHTNHIHLELHPHVQ